MNTTQKAEVTKSAHTPSVSSRASQLSTKAGSSTKGNATGTECFEFLQQLPEFARIPEGELKALASHCRFASVARGKTILTEGEDEAVYGFIVVSGCIAVSKASSSGRMLVVELLQARDVFGLMMSLSGECAPTQLSAHSLQTSIVLWMPIESFKSTLHNHPSHFTDHVTHLLRCLHSSYGLARGLAHDRVEVRIAAILSSLAVKFWRKTSAKNEPYVIEFTRQQLADLTGTTPETAIRITRAMQRDGLISVKKPGVIEVLDLKALLALAQDW